MLVIDDNSNDNDTGVNSNDDRTMTEIETLLGTTFLCPRPPKTTISTLQRYDFVFYDREIKDHCTF